MAEILGELRALSDDEIIARHDKSAQRTVVGTGHYLRELERRDQQRQTEQMLEYTRSVRSMTLKITILTGVMAVLTLVNVIAVLR